jgi:hypothetical protein
LPTGTATMSGLDYKQINDAGKEGRQAPLSEAWRPEELKNDDDQKFIWAPNLNRRAAMMFVGNRNVGPYRGSMASTPAPLSAL